MHLNTRKMNNPMKKWREDLNRHFSKEDIQIADKQTQEKMLNIMHYQWNANQNHNEVPSHIGQNGCHQKSTNNKCRKGCGEKGTLLHC